MYLFYEYGFFELTSKELKTIKKKKNKDIIDAKFILILALSNIYLQVYELILLRSHSSYLEVDFQCNFDFCSISFNQNL